MKQLVLFLEIVLLSGSLVDYAAFLLLKLTFIFLIQLGLVLADLFTETLCQLSLEVSIWKGQLLLKVLKLLGKLSDLKFL